MKEKLEYQRNCQKCDKLFNPPNRKIHWCLSCRGAKDFEMQRSSPVDNPRQDMEWYKIKVERKSDYDTRLELSVRLLPDDMWLLIREIVNTVIPVEDFSKAEEPKQIR